MTKTRQRSTIARGQRLGSVDYTMLSIPLVGFLTLLVPLFLAIFYYGPMSTQNGQFVVADCTRTSLEDGEASFACSGEFLPDDGSDTITRPPHWYSAEGKIFEPGDEVAMTLYENDNLVREGTSPVIYQILFISGGSFAFVGVFILWAYVARWFASRKRARDDTSAATSTPTVIHPAPTGVELAPTDIDLAPTDVDPAHGPSRLTGLPVQANGWDAEPPVERRARVGLVGIMLVVSLAGTVAAFTLAGTAQIQRNAVPHTTGTVTIANCATSLDLDIGRLRPYVYCEGPFTAAESDDRTAFVPTDRVAFEPRDNKVYQADEVVPVTVYRDGGVRDSEGPDPRAVPGIIWGITLAFTSVLLCGLLWLSRSARR
jgi:hypothetical protein